MHNSGCGRCEREQLRLITWNNSGKYISSKLCLERFILQNQSANTGFLLYVSQLCYSCVFHKTSRSTIFFLITVDESRQLEVARASDTHRLVQAICDSVTNRLNTNNTQYFIQSIFCSCQLSKADRQKILNCYKSSKKKMNMAVKRKCLVLNLNLQTKKGA